MNSAQTELFRIALLQQLREVGAECSLPVPTLVVGLMISGFDSPNEDIVRSGLAYLADKGLVAPVAKTISPENKRWRITADGIDHLAEAGL